MLPKIMIPRTLIHNIVNALTYSPAVALFGARQVGKTTLVRSLLSLLGKPFVYLDLERESDVQRLETPELFLVQHQDSCVIIDEAQRMPSLFPLIRSLIDAHRVPGRFVLLGSASPLLRRGLSESLAGRVAYFDVSPLHRLELLRNENRQQENRQQENTQNKNGEFRENQSLEMLWLRGGFPPSLLAASDEISDLWRRDFIRSYVERDLPQMLLTAIASAQGGRFTTSLAMRLWRMLAHYQGSILNASELALSLGVSAPTVTRYIEILEDADLVRRLMPFHANTKKRLVKSPKIYLRDSGLLHSLADIPSLYALQGHPVLGQSWEGFVIEQISCVLSEQGKNRFETTFFRTQNGNECDMVVLKNGEPFISIEIKYSDAPRLTKGHTLALEDLQTPHNYVIVPHAHPYPVRNATIVCGLDAFLITILPEILT